MVGSAVSDTDLKKGELVAVSGAYNLPDGAAVKVAGEESSHEPERKAGREVNRRASLALAQYKSRRISPHGQRPQLCGLGSGLISVSSLQLPRSYAWSA